MKKKILSFLIFIPIFLAESCVDDYNTQKSETQKMYDQFLQKNEKSLDLIVNKCYQLKINYIKSDSLLQVIQTDSLSTIIKTIDYLDLINLADYIAYDIKLKYKENKCVSFFLTKPFFSKINDTTWGVRVIDKSPCF